MSCKAIHSINLNASASVLNTSLTRRVIPYRHPIKSRTSDPYLSPSPRLRFGSSIQVNLVPNVELCPNTRGRFITPNARLSQTETQFPLLPFPIDQVLVPSENKTLHLYEARYLALLEESLFKKKKVFVHFVLDPVAIADASAEVSFAARYGCLVIIEKVERLDVGALVSIRGIGRVKIVEFVQADPYLKGLVIPQQDNVPDSAPKEALLQTQIANSLMWAEKEPSLDCDEAFVPSFAERVSFAALQPVSASTQSELLALQKEKLRAMDIKDTIQRVDKSIEFVKKNISMVAAKLAIQSLEAQ
uniref:Lon N-terminal domain-containing protein n=1 Tax=Davidia involucrata TaxID=16924 RepID=A0A5B6ZZW2_DAVIN